MAETAPILSELRIFSFGIVPTGWVACNGQMLSVNQNQSLFQLLGTTYGGDGINTFAVPDLQIRVPYHRGPLHPQGSKGGEEKHVLTLNEIPNHTHQPIASSNVPDSNTAQDNYWAVNPEYTPYGLALDNPDMAPGALATTGEDLPHNNMAPYLVVNICMAVKGLFPSSNTYVDSDQFVSEVRMFAGKVVPNAWFTCDGQTLPVSSYSALFSFLGDTFGGQPGNTFGLPDLRDRATLGVGKGNQLQPYILADTGGVETVTLTKNEIPAHNHLANAGAPGNDNEPDGKVWANPYNRTPPLFYASNIGTSLLMHPEAIIATGGGEEHNNLMPYLAVVFCIASKGVSPTHG